MAIPLLTRHPSIQTNSQLSTPSVAPEGTFFVVGDNLANNFDSRTPEFGPVTDDMLRGKPLYLYWSPNLHRIGCPLR